MLPTRSSLPVLAAAALVAGCGVDRAGARRRAERALGLLADGDAAAAEAALAPALEAAPDVAAVREAAGRLALAGLRPDAAIPHLRAAIHLEDHPRRRGLLGRALLGVGRLDDAADELENALAQRGDSPEILRDAVEVFARTGQSARALELAETLRALDGSHPGSILRVARAYLRAGKRDEARNLTRTLSDSLVTSVEELVLLGGLAYELGEAPRAISAFARALEALPGSARLRYNLGTARVLAGRFREAKGDFEAVLAATPEDAAAKGQLAFCLSKLGRLETAKRLLAEAIAAAPEDQVLRLLDEEFRRR